MAKAKFAETWRAWLARVDTGSAGISKRLGGRHDLGA
jgi:hypothetical protein